MARLSPEQIARNKEIDRLRTEWGVQEPELHVMPAWLKSRVHAAIKRGDIPKSGYILNGWSAVQHAIQSIKDLIPDTGGWWFDHAGRLKCEDGTFVLISEPYQLNDGPVRQLDLFCKILGLTYHVEARSWWFPGRALRIVITEKQPS